MASLGVGRNFLPVITTLSLQWHLYALDYRGQGKSGWVPGQYQSQYYVADVTSFLKRQLDRPAILFGQSAGGMVAIGVAAQYPELVRAVIVGDSPMDMDMLIAWMTSEAFQQLFSYFRSIAGSDLPQSDLIKNSGYPNSSTRERYSHPV